MKRMMESVQYRKVLKTVHRVFLLILLAAVFGRVEGQISAQQPETGLPKVLRPSYMIYYGGLDDTMIERARKYDIVILHPGSGNITREQVKKIQEAGTKVMGYLSVGEDLRTAGMTPEEMLNDERFTGNGTGPRIDARKHGDHELADVRLEGRASPAGGGYASYYLDDNDHDGKPDFNPNFGCAYTNMGDPAWYDVLENMTMDGFDGIPGIRETLTYDYGRGLGCDGVFLDTIYTCAPNIYTDDANPCRTRFEWTAPGALRFMERLKKEYPDKYVVQNRGLFFFNYAFPHFNYAPGRYIDFLMYESYMLDSNTAFLYNETYFLDNKNIYAPKITAEANRPEGFQILSLGYAEGPEEYRLKETLTGNEDTGQDILMEDIEQAQEKAGFSHYITDGALMLANDFVLEHGEKEDTKPPVWSSVHNESLKHSPVPHIGVREAEPVAEGMILRWDAAIDKSGVDYTVYYQKEPFDFKRNPELEGAQKATLVPETGEGYEYGAGTDALPYQAVLMGLDAGEKYYFVIRAKDRSEKNNEEKNTVVMEGVPLK